MKIDKLENVEGFLNVVNSCKGEIELVTGEGDRLNLKSKLSQIVSLASIFPQLHEIPNVEIIAHEPEDMEKIAEFLFR